MMTKFAALHERWVPRGSLGRFALAGAFNSSIFFIAWTVSMWLFPEVDVRLLWGLFWGLTGLLAHFVHRLYTFDDHKSLAWTLPAAVPVYVGSLVGSSMTIGWLSEKYPTQIEWMGIPNMLCWGVLIWLTMRVFVFQFTPSTQHVSQEDQME
ncbi:MAG: hypothetical protein VX778_05830 [Candidatus Thermoplasmatota archaeon]|nr:hypothetical protein [Candidatus Thermoplasmatota archaeon]